ncbi:UNVERIFIED_CONTAM: hypothetical protein GTU68_036328 [Idotea baltica]|nr:hypothetical protein [Idotea baltica]
MVERGRSSQRSHGVASMRSSQRSHGTSSSSSHESRLVCKDCCRKFVSFMCTQVGVGGLLISYAIMGSFAFIAIEGKSELNVYNQTQVYHEKAIRRMWHHTEKFNVLHKKRWYANINDTLFDLQNEIVTLVKSGYDGRLVQDIWTFPASLMFSLSVFTMIGYGHMTPRTDWGKIATILYAVLGIPLYIVYFMNMGKVFAKSFKFLYRTLYRCINKEKLEATMKTGDEEPIIIVPSTACIWVMIVYMMTGTIMFAEWEQWSYLNSCYFSFTSLAKIGIGDFVPGIGGTGTTKDSQTKLIINFMYLLIGMGLIAMCYTLMKEEILLKLRTTKQELKEKLYYCGLRIGLYSEDQPPLIQPQRLRNSRSRRTVRRR